MKPHLFAQLAEILGPGPRSHIAEIGTHHGGTAAQLVELLAPRVVHLTYWGYDVFDQRSTDPDFHKLERNGKGAGSLARAQTRLDQLKATHGNFDYVLHQGLTTDTLITAQQFDFVYIDGGHSYDTVKHDYTMVNGSRLIVFDDLKITGVRRLITELEAQGLDIDIVQTQSKHIWAVIRN